MSCIISASARIVDFASIEYPVDEVGCESNVWRGLVSSRGDEFRDNYSRALTCVASYASVSVDDCIIAVVNEGNRVAIKKHAETCLERGSIPPMASQFAVSTSSAGPSGVSILKGARGGCHTISGGSDNYISALFVAAPLLRRAPNAKTHLFIEESEKNPQRRLKVLSYICLETGAGSLSARVNVPDYSVRGERYQECPELFQAAHSNRLDFYGFWLSGGTAIEIEHHG